MSTAYMSSPCHIEVVLTEKEEVVAKVAEDEPAKKKVSKKKLARQKEKMMREQDTSMSFLINVKLIVVYLLN